MTDSPRSIRGKLLRMLYDRYIENPLEMFSPADIMDETGLDRRELLPNMYYLHDRGLVELLTGFNPPLFAAARINANGIDTVEDTFRFSLLFSGAKDEGDHREASSPWLLERLMAEVEFSALDGEERLAALRDVQFLRDEASRPPRKWRYPAMRTLLEWVRSHYTQAGLDPEEAVPSLSALESTLARDWEEESSRGSENTFQGIHISQESSEDIKQK